MRARMGLRRIKARANNPVANSAALAGVGTEAAAAVSDELPGELPEDESPVEVPADEFPDVDVLPVGVDPPFPAAPPVPEGSPFWVIGPVGEPMGGVDPTTAAWAATLPPEGSMLMADESKSLDSEGKPPPVEGA